MKMVSEEEKEKIKMELFCLLSLPERVKMIRLLLNQVNGYYWR